MSNSTHAKCIVLQHIVLFLIKNQVIFFLLLLFVLNLWWLTQVHVACLAGCYQLLPLH